MTGRTTKKLTAAQRRELEGLGESTEHVYIRRNPDAPKEKERGRIAAALKDVRETERELAKERGELIEEFLRTDPRARELTKELKEIRGRMRVLESRQFYSPVDICRDGGWATHVLASGDSFPDALARLKRRKGAR